MIIFGASPAAAGTAELMPAEVATCISSARARKAPARVRHRRSRDPALQPGTRPSAGLTRRDRNGGAGRQNRRVGHSFTQPTIKLLFATARTCAYPGCQVPLVFEDRDRDVRSVSVQIAHMRSPKATGPRYDPDYPKDKLNSDENLLLLCWTHHHPVDSNESKYTIEELLEWKKSQVTDAGGFIVQDSDIAGIKATLESSLDELVRATQLQMTAKFVGGRLGLSDTPTVVRTDLDGLSELEQRIGHLLRPGRLIGIEVVNRGPVGAEVQAVGIDVDHGPGRPGPWNYGYVSNNLTEWGIPARVDGNTTRAWFDTEHRIRAFMDGLYANYGLVPRRFRAWAQVGNGDRLEDEWIARADLPIWEPDVGEADLGARYREPA